MRSDDWIHPKLAQNAHEIQSIKETIRRHSTQTKIKVSEGTKLH